jgi:uncharacterized membrane protein
MSASYKPLIVAGLFLGLGMGGFFDGILFHQILQTHNMLTARVAKDSLAHVEVNMFWDGVFHAATWITTLVGIALFYRAGRRADAAWSARVLAGSMFMGWGSFNLVEGLIDHHLLHLHHVVEQLGVSIFDYLFLASGLIFLLVGWFAARSNQPSASVTHPAPAKARHAGPLDKAASER